MANIKCLDCNPEYTHYPDDAVYITEDIPGLGLKAGTSLKVVLKTMVKAMSLGVNADGLIAASNVSAAAPPTFLTSGYSKSWDKISLSNGWFYVESISTDRVVSFDFSDVLANLGAGISVTNITTEIFITEKGSSRSLSRSSKPANSYRIDMNLFPVNITIRVELRKEEDANPIYLNKSLTLGNMAVDKSLFKFEIKGFDTITQYTAEDIYSLMYAKMANISNYLDDLKSRNIVTNVAGMEAKIKRLEDDMSKDIEFEIDRRKITLPEFIADMNNKMAELLRKIEKYEK